MSPTSAPTHRFYEFAVLDELPFVFDLVGCHPRLDLVSKTLREQSEKEKKREKRGRGQIQAETRHGWLTQRPHAARRLLADRDDI